MKAAELIVRCLESEAVEYIFGLPGEENMDVLDALLASSIQFVMTRHEPNPDFVRYAESFGARGYRVAAADELAPALHAALQQNTLSVIDCPIDFNENLKLTEKLGSLVCPT
jgi:thiamine pyrophosphate-dependent acetolactate synthase large subunit-like protein